MHGLLNLNKPAGVTSRDVVNRVQELVYPAKCGHAGTLDPLATGVLVVCVGNGTRLTEYVQRYSKCYEATFLFGRQSNTDDIDGTVVEIPGARPPLRTEIDSALPSLVGDIHQRPPDFSAVKVRGKRAYQLARRGEHVRLVDRLVTVYSLAVVRYEYPELELAICCGSGTYVRSLGRDLASALGTTAVMSRLVRTAIGPFRLADAVDPLTISTTSVFDVLLPLARAVEGLPAISLNNEEMTRVRKGQLITRAQHGLQGDVAAFDPQENLCAIVVPRDPDQLGPSKVFLDGE